VRSPRDRAHRGRQRTPVRPRHTARRRRRPDQAPGRPEVPEARRRQSRGSGPTTGHSARAAAPLRPTHPGERIARGPGSPRRCRFHICSFVSTRPIQPKRSRISMMFPDAEQLRRRADPSEPGTLRAASYPGSRRRSTPAISRSTRPRGHARHAAATGRERRHRARQRRRDRPDRGAAGGRARLVRRLHVLRGRRPRHRGRTRIQDPGSSQGRLPSKCDLTSSGSASSPHNVDAAEQSTCPPPRPRTCDPRRQCSRSRGRSRPPTQASRRKITSSRPAPGYHRARVPLAGGRPADLGLLVTWCRVP
jgi:hypothetical protein